MALTPSTMMALGTEAPDFSLRDTDGQLVSLADFAGSKALLVMFICNHFPYVKHVAAELARIGRDYARDDLGVVAISANDAAAYPADSPARMKEEKAARGYEFPYLHDETQQTARAYHAACTPDFFLFDRERSLVYRGQLDDSRPGNNAPVDGRDLRAAIDAVLAGRKVAQEQKPSIGCNIKWKPGHAPDYAP